MSQIDVKVEDNRESVQQRNPRIKRAKFRPAFKATNWYESAARAIAITGAERRDCQPRDLSGPTERVPRRFAPRP
jgi:hypothetical protein